MQRYEIRPYSLLQERLHDRQVGHSAVMAALPRGLGQSPRAKARCLWRYEQDAGLLTVQTDRPVKASVLGELVQEAPLPSAVNGSSWQVDAVFNCEKTPPSAVPVELRRVLKQSGRCYRSHKVIVPQRERVSWCVNRLSARGFQTDPGTLEIGELSYADLGRRHGAIPYIRVTCTGHVIDADAWNDAIASGIGGGRNFGLGLVYTIPSQMKGQS